MNKKFWISFILILISMFPMGISHAVPLYLTREMVGRAFEESIRELRIPGGVMMVQTPEGERWTLTAGVRTMGTDIPLTRNIRFRIGSITKTFVASVILMLADECRLGLDQEVSVYFPEYADQETSLTIRHLLQMRSNLGNFSNNAEFLNDFRKKPWTRWTPHKLLSYKSMSHKKAGVAFEYNNSNYVLLGLIIEKVTGDSVENQIYKRILKPLKLTYTSFPAENSRVQEPFASGYDYNPETGRVNDLSLAINPSWAWCSGNGVSTAPDIMIWITNYLNGYGISRELFVEQMEFCPSLYYGISYGLGVMNKYGAVGHNGNYAGIYTALAFKFRGFYFVIMTNGQSYGGGRDATAEAVFWKIVAKTPLFDW